MQSPLAEAEPEETGAKEVAIVDVKRSLRPDDVDLRTLVSHRASARATDTVESVFSRLATDGLQFIAVVDDRRLLGLCSRHQISELVSGRFGFALFARKPIAKHLSTKETRICMTSPIADVLEQVFARSDDAFYDDIILVDETGAYQGLITTQTLFKVQDALLRTSLQDQIAKERVIKEKNQQMENDLLMATELQQALMSVTPPVFPPGTSLETTSLRFSYLYRPCDLIGGDFFYTLRLSDSCAGMFICDVMGHGVRSALVTSMLRALIEGLEAKANDPGELMTHLNNELTSIVRQTGTVLFVTALYCTLDAATGRLRYACAGHPHPIHLDRSNARVAVLHDEGRSSGMALGLVPGGSYHVSEVALEPRDSILLFTDGITEAENCDSELYGIEALTESLTRNLATEEDSLLEATEADVRLFAGETEFQDDVCLVMAQWRPRSTN